MLERSISAERHWSILKRIHLPGDAEGAVAHVPSCPAGDLAQFGGRQLAILESVEFLVLGKSHVVDIEIEAHPDRVRGDEIIHIAGLIERHLRVARARAECAQNDGRSAALPADQFADRIDLVRRKSDYGGPAGQPRDLFRSGIGEHGHARACDDGNAPEHFFKDAAHCAGAEKQGFLPPTEI
jgi:hypothetical protein